MAYVYTPSSIDYTPLSTKKRIEYPLIEQDIIELHQQFLTSGFHAIQVANVQSGRLIIQSLLSSLALYHDIGIVTLENMSLPFTAFDVKQAFQKSLYASVKNKELFNDLFIEYFTFDFMWIEVSSDLLRSEWFLDFEEVIRRLNVYLHMPIFYVSYDE